MENNGPLLRLATYMCPGMPVEYYEFLAEYLEHSLNLRTELIYSSKRPGPDVSRGDHNRVDIAFVSTSTFLDKFKTDGSGFNLLPVGGVSKHPVKGQTLGYYSDVIIHRDVKERVKEFYDIRGCKFVHANETSLASNKIVLRMLKQMGEDASFFSDIQASGNHMNSVEMVVSKKAEAAAVDSVSLANYFTKHYYQKPEIHLQVSWGPLPPHPILVNSKLDPSLKSRIVEALLKISTDGVWSQQLSSFSITGFQKTSLDNYLEAIDILQATKQQSFGITYY